MHRDSVNSSSSDDDDDDVMVPVELRDLSPRRPAPAMVEVPVTATAVTPAVTTITEKDVDQFSSSMSMAIILVDGLISRDADAGWNMLPDDSSPGMLRVHLFEHARLPGTFMARAVVKGLAERFAYVARDYDKQTRLAWDCHDGVVHTAQLESYLMKSGHTLSAVECRIRSPVPMASDRHLVGVQTYLFSKTLPPDTHKVLFCSVAANPRFKCPVDAVSVGGVVAGVVVRQLEDKISGSTRTRECEITLVVQVKELNNAIGVNYLTAGFYLGATKERLRRRVRLYQDVVHNWDTYYGPSRDPKRLENRK